jgi:hypothetical protein
MPTINALKATVFLIFLLVRTFFKSLFIGLMKINLKFSGSTMSEKAFVAARQAGRRVWKVIGRYASANNSLRLCRNSGDYVCLYIL